MAHISLIFKNGLALEKSKLGGDIDTHDRIISLPMVLKEICPQFCQAEANAVLMLSNLRCFPGSLVSAFAAAGYNWEATEISQAATNLLYELGERGMIDGAAIAPNRQVSGAVNPNPRQQ